MKYPIVKVKQTPLGFKHCSLTTILHIKFLNEETFISGEDIEIKQAYVTFLKNELAMTIDSLMTLARPQVVYVKDEYIVLMKDNVDMFKLDAILNQLLEEVSRYTQGLINFETHILNCLVFEEGKDPTMFKANKIGDDVFDSEEYKKVTVEYVSDSKLEVMNVLTPYLEFKRKNEKKPA